MIQMIEYSMFSVGKYFIIRYKIMRAHQKVSAYFIMRVLWVQGNTCCWIADEQKTVKWRQGGLEKNRRKTVVRRLITWVNGCSKNV